MKSVKRRGVLGTFVAVFLAIFALPFLGAYFMLDEETETKVIGGFLCLVGLILWFLFGIR